MHEVEVKLALDGPFEMPSLATDRLPVKDQRELPPLTLRATYYDSSDLRLARNGITLRWRSGDEKPSGWTLKMPLPGEDGVVRRELFFEGTYRTVPASARDLVTAFLRSARLEAVARLRTKRRRWVLLDEVGGDLAEISDDDVTLLEGRKAVDSYHELEVEAISLDRGDLETIAGRLRGDGAPASPQLPKLVRLLGAKARERPDLAIPDDLEPTAPATAAVSHSIATGLQRMVWNDPGVRLGEVEPTHQMRVGARRLRSDLRTFGPLVEEDWSAHLVAELKWLAELLGPVRDADVLRSRLRSSGSDLSNELEVLFDALALRREERHSALMQGLRSTRYTDLLESLVAGARAPKVTDLAEGECAEVLPPLGEKAWRKLDKHVAKVGKRAADEELHRARILTKRARYAAEAIAPALDSKSGRAARRFAARASDVQDVLGAVQDAAMARAAVEEIAVERSADGPLNFVAGRLFEREKTLAGDVRAEFWDAWSKLATKKSRGWMTG